MRKTLRKYQQVHALQIWTITIGFLMLFGPTAAMSESLDRRVAKVDRIPAESRLATPPDQVIQLAVSDMQTKLRPSENQFLESTDEISEVVQETIMPHVDIAYMSRLILGKHWRRATPEQRNAFKHEFQLILARSYAAPYREYKDSNLVVSPTRVQSTETRSKVRAALEIPGANPIPMLFSMNKSENRWRVYDVVIDGISLVHNYRTSYASIIRRNGIDGLVVVLAEKNKPKGG